MAVDVGWRGQMVVVVAAAIIDVVLLLLLLVAVVAGENYSAVALPACALRSNGTVEKGWCSAAAAAREFRPLDASDPTTSDLDHRSGVNGVPAGDCNGVRWRISKNRLHRRIHGDFCFAPTRYWKLWEKRIWRTGEDD